jgi:hypothetical protein
MKLANHLAKKFSDYKANLNGRVSAVTAACNKMLKYIEGGKRLKGRQLLILLELQENESLRAQTKHGNKKDKMKIEKKKPETTYEVDYWYCAHCTFANPKAAKKCDMCQQVKKVLKNPTF